VNKREVLGLVALLLSSKTMPAGVRVIIIMIITPEIIITTTTAAGSATTTTTTTTTTRIDKIFTSYTRNDNNLKREPYQFLGHPCHPTLTPIRSFHFRNKTFLKHKRYNIYNNLKLIKYRLNVNSLE
jgi:hypothetical protein